MNEQQETRGADLERGLPMVARWEPEALAAEKEALAELATKGFGERCRGYLSRIGPGWLQSALTLGGGSAAASLFAGAYMEYRLLWVQPVAMILGIIMLAAMAYQTLATGVRPFDALRHYTHPAFAWAWAIASLAATVIWHFPQYALAGEVVNMMGKAVSGERLVIPPWLVGLCILPLATWITWSYGRSARGIRTYERALRYMVWGIVLALLIVVIRRAAYIDWGGVFKGYTTFYIPGREDPRAVSVMIAAFGAAVGINMTFLFPYTLLARGWGREHHGLVRFDLMTGMLVPYALATSLMVIAAGSTIYGTEYVPEKGTGMSAVSAAQVLGGVMGPAIGQFIFGIGILGMALSTITLHMLVSAFIVCEILDWEPTGWRYRIGSLIPAVGVLGPVLWKHLFWLPVPTSAICGLMLPVAYIGFWILHNRRAYLGNATPTGGAAIAWNIGMAAAVLASLGSAGYYLATKIPPFVQQYFGG
jgi:manganese transport protein